MCTWIGMASAPSSPCETTGSASRPTSIRPPRRRWGSSSSTPSRPSSAVPSLALASVLLASTPMLLAARPMSLEDLLLAVRVGDPQLAPDGRVFYVRTTTDLASGKRNADVWSVRADGSAPMQITRDPKADNTPRVSPDGKRLAFISTRGGTPQVYILDLAGGEAR